MWKVAGIFFLLTCRMYGALAPTLHQHTVRESNSVSSAAALRRRRGIARVQVYVCVCAIRSRIFKVKCADDHNLLYNTLFTEVKATRAPIAHTLALSPYACIGFTTPSDARRFIANTRKYEAA